jgi:hypothetical protein
MSGAGIFDGDPVQNEVTPSTIALPVLQTFEEYFPAGISPYTSALMHPAKNIPRIAAVAGKVCVLWAVLRLCHVSRHCMTVVSPFAQVVGFDARDQPVVAWSFARDAAGMTDGIDMAKVPGEVSKIRNPPWNSHRWV